MSDAGQWRIGFDLVDGGSLTWFGPDREVDRSPEPIRLTCTVDEIVLGGWLHVEQLDDSVWHVRVGDAVGTVVDGEVRWDDIR